MAEKGRTRTVADEVADEVLRIKREAQKRLKGGE